MFACRFGLALVVVAGCVFGIEAAGAQDKEKPKFEAFKGVDGTWSVIGMEQNGIKVPDNAVGKLNMKLTIKGVEYVVTMADQVIDKGTSAINTKKQPNTVDIKSDFGPNKGKTILAIVEMNGDALKACYDLKDNKRPTEFATKEGTGLVLILYKREAKKNGN
jgi:uncharacterized protein (TIGR03067 family)